MIKSGFVPITILIILGLVIFPCKAIEPAWTFADDGRKIGDIVIAPDGSSVAAAMGRVVLLSQNGTVLAKEPYGENMAQSRDGSSIVTAYSSAVSLFKKNTDITGDPVLEKIWEAVSPDRVISFAVSASGERIAISSGGVSGVDVYNGTTGDRIGHSNEYSSLIAISDDGNRIAGISTINGLKVYNASGEFMNISSEGFMNTSGGDLVKKYEFALSRQPNSFLMDTEGTIVVFNAGPQIIAFDISKGAELWKQRSASDVNMLAMTPYGMHIVAGTENGTVECYDVKGDLKWTYYSNSGTGSGQAITAIAVARSGSKIVAGSADGKILLLDPEGKLLWTYNTGKDGIEKVAIAADGSFAVAAGDHTLYAFTNTRKSTTTVPVSTQKPVSIPVTLTPFINMTEYTIIRKATQSPLEGMAGIAALLIVVSFILRKDR